MRKPSCVSQSFNFSIFQFFNFSIPRHFNLIPFLLQYLSYFISLVSLDHYFPVLYTATGSALVFEHFAQAFQVCPLADKASNKCGHLAAPAFDAFLNDKVLLFSWEGFRLDFTILSEFQVRV